MTQRYLYFAVFSSGMATSGIEFAASSLLGNVYGSTNVVWASIIGLILVNQQENGGIWNHLGTFSFTAPEGGTVVLSAPGTSPVSYSADAVKFVYVPSQDVPVMIKSPYGGETVATGTEYAITWSAPANAASFNLFYSIDNGSTWQVIAQGVSGNSYVWQVPTVKKNKRNCLIKVIGHSASNEKMGAAVSDGISIEMTKLTSLNGGQTLTAASTASITWLTHSTERNP